MYNTATTTMFTIKDLARVFALQFDKLYKADKTSDFVQLCHEFYREYKIQDCTIKDFESACYYEYAKL